jgi:hypothetical protein
MAVLATALTIGFASCDGGDNPEEVTDNVTVKITGLPNETNGMGGSVTVYTAKPVQFEGIGDGVASGTLMNGVASPLAGDPRSGEYFYQGGEGYILLTTIPRLGVDKYFHFISKNKATLKKGDNVFDFTKDFEILHDYGGNGILRIEGVPDIYEGSISIEITEYPYKIGDDGVYDDALRAKPLGYDGIPYNGAPGYVLHHTADYLALPLGGFTNQRFNTTFDRWDYEFTDKRFDLTRICFVSIRGFGTPPVGEEWYYYADLVHFTDGNATVQWADIKKRVYTLNN